MRLHMPLCLQPMIALAATAIFCGLGIWFLPLFFKAACLNVGIPESPAIHVAGLVMIAATVLSVAAISAVFIDIMKAGKYHG